MLKFYLKIEKFRFIIYDFINCINFINIYFYNRVFYCIYFLYINYINNKVSIFKLVIKELINLKYKINKKFNLINFKNRFIKHIFNYKFKFFLYLSDLSIQILYLKFIILFFKLHYFFLNKKDFQKRI